MTLNPAKVGMTVIILIDNLLLLQWPLAVIEKLYPGKDGIVRIAEVRTKNASYTRRDEVMSTSNTIVILYLVHA